MKKILLLICAVVSYSGMAQNITMQNGSFTTCSGTFYDSGGESSNYADNENFIFTICPDEVDGRVKLDFDNSFNVSSDILTIYDNDAAIGFSFGSFTGTLSPGLIVATQDNPTGCITVKFFSNNSGNSTGWAAAISCVEPCQDITAQLDSTFPVANEEGIVEVCTGESVNLSGSGIFEVDGTGANYTWDLGDGTEAFGQNVDVSYDVPGVYLVDLEIRDTNTENVVQGCPNTNSINLIIRVSGEPDFSGTQAADNTLCFGETTTIEGVVTPLNLLYNCPPPESGTTFLPDGSGAAYTTSINVTCFEDGQTLTDISQIESICLNMEHSYLGDLDIEIISPNGQIVRMHDQGGGNANLGIPWATNVVDGQSGIVTPGTGFDYCFVPGAGFPTLVDGIQAGGVFPIGDGSETYIDNFVPAGNYSSINPLEGLIGSPLNGNWTIRIVDNISADNGYIFSWELNFDPNLQLADFNFTPTIVSQSWDADPTITEINGNTITVAPQSGGEFCYTYRTVDVFGCEYTEEVCVYVATEDSPFIPFYEDLDGDGFGDVNSASTAIACTDIAPEGLVPNNLDCNDVNGLINPGANDSQGNGVDENCDGADGLSLNDVSAIGLNVRPNPFKNSLTIDLPNHLIGKPISIQIYDLNGRLVFKSINANTNSQLKIENLSDLEKAPYFLKISSEEIGVNVVKKLIKM